MPKKSNHIANSLQYDLFAKEMSEKVSLFDMIDPCINEIEVIAKFNGDIMKIARELDAEAEVIYENYAIITIDKSKLGRLNSHAEIEHLELPKKSIR